MTSTSLAERPCSTPHPTQLRGDETELYRRHQRALLRRTRRAVGGPDALVEDACQIAWTQFVRRQPEPRETVLAWLTVVARHEAYRLVRDYRRTMPASEVVITDAHGRPTPFDPDQAAAPERDPLVGMEARELLASLAELNPSQRTVLTLRIGGFSYKEIQKVCGGKTYTWVNRHITEGRAALRARMTEAHDG